MTTLIKADELAKDLSGAHALLQRHRERKVEEGGREKREVGLKEYELIAE